MSRANTWLSSKVSPVLIRRAARSTLVGVMWLPEPRSSAAPHFDGQRSLVDGGCQLCALAFAAKTERPNAMTAVRLFIAFLLCSHGQVELQDIELAMVSQRY